MKSNADLQKNVQDAIKWEPLLNTEEIGVIVKDGVVTLAGTVDSYAKRAEAEFAAKSVTGVKAVVEKIKVRYSGSWAKKNDNEIATEAITALKWNGQVPRDKVKVKVEKGWVTLEGELEWNYQKDAARDAIVYLLGVTGVSNNITIKSETDDQVEKKDIENAFRRNWSLDGEDITVEVKDHKVTLTGTVDSGYQRDEAARITWKARGVWEIDNKLVVNCD